MSRRATTKWNLFFFYLRTIIGLINGLLILPLYLKYIDNTLFGVWLASGNILTWVTVVDPGVGDVLIQKVSVAFSKRNKKLLQNIFTSSIIISSVVSFLALTLSFIFSKYLKEILNVSSDIALDELLFAFNVNAVATCITLFSYCLSGTILGFQKTRELGIITTVTGILGIVLNVTLLFNGFGLSAIAYSSLFKTLLTTGIYGVFLIVLFKHEQLRLKFSLRYFKSYIKLFSYTFFSRFFGTIASNLDLIIISRYLGPSAVTVLEITRRPIKIAQSFVNIPSQSLLPAFSNLYGEGNGEKISSLLKRFISTFSFMLFLFVAGFVVFTKDLISLWVGSQFYIGDTNNYILCIGILLTTLCYNLSNLTYCMGNIKGNSKIESIKSVLYILVLLVLTKFFGITGAVLAVLLSTLVTEAIYYPWQIIKKTGLDQSTLNSLYKTFAAGVVVSLLLIISFSSFESLRWSVLIMKATIFSVIYAVMYYLLDKTIRTEINQAAERLISRWRRV